MNIIPGAPKSEAFRGVIHIAGTNGKGSVAEYLSHIITASGRRCACFTSPHIVAPTERMRVDGQYVGADTLDRLLEEVREKGLAVNDTRFAAYTAAALLWFARMGAEYAVIETGLGGRLDPTTRSIHPSVTVLTPIDYDHMHLLGHSLEQIAQEKCGIIRAGVPVVSARQHAVVEKVIAAHCKRVHCPLRFVDREQVVSRSLDGQVFLSGGERYAIHGIGTAQPGNAALAAAAAGTLGFDAGSVRAGLENTRLACRTQYIVGDPDMLIDGAHNVAAMDALLQTMDTYFADRHKVLLFACMKDKDYAAMIGRLGPRFSDVVVTSADEARGADAGELCAQFSRFVRCTAQADAAGAFQKAKALARGSHALLVAGGSFYLAGMILALGLR